jgi:hypothetical protein
MTAQHAILWLIETSSKRQQADHANENGGRRAPAGPIRARESHVVKESYLERLADLELANEVSLNMDH